MRIYHYLRKRGLALFMALVMCLSLLPAQAMAEGIEIPDAILSEDPQEDADPIDLDEAAPAGPGEGELESDDLDVGNDDPADPDEEQKGPASSDEGQAAPDLEETVPADAQEFLNAVAAIQPQLDKEDLTAAEARIADADAAYGALAPESAVRADVQEAVSQLDAAKAEAAALGERLVAEFLAAVDAIPASITAENLEEASARIAGAQAAYQRLDEAGKADVSVMAAYSVLLDAGAAADEARKPAEVLIPEDATLVTPDRLPAVAKKAAMSVWNLFGLVRDNYRDVLDENFPETLTFVGETVEDTVRYEDAREDDPAVVRVTEDAILYRGEPVTVYFQGVVRTEEYGSSVYAERGLQNTNDAVFLHYSTWAGNSKGMRHYQIFGALYPDIDGGFSEWGGGRKACLHLYDSEGKTLGTANLNDKAQYAVHWYVDSSKYWFHIYESEVTINYEDGVTSVSFGAMASLTKTYDVYIKAYDRTTYNDNSYCTVTQRSVLSKGTQNRTVNVYADNQFVGSWSGLFPNRTNAAAGDLSVSNVNPKYVPRGNVPGGGATVTVSGNNYNVYLVSQYAVTYNANGGSSAPGSQTKYHDIALTLSTATPTRTGYNFTGWNTQSDGKGTAYAAGASYTANEAVTLYAQWTPKQYPYEIHHIYGGKDEAQDTGTMNFGETLTPTQKPKTGYTFDKADPASLVIKETGNVINVYYTKDTVYHTTTITAGSGVTGVDSGFTKGLDGSYTLTYEESDDALTVNLTLDEKYEITKIIVDGVELSSKSSPVPLGQKNKAHTVTIETAPKKPTDDEVKTLFADKITVKCQMHDNDPENSLYAAHTPVSCLADGTFSIGDVVTEADGSFTCTVTVDVFKCVEAYNANTTVNDASHSPLTHNVYGYAREIPVVLTYTNGQWALPADMTPIEITARCYHHAISVVKTAKLSDGTEIKETDRLPMGTVVTFEVTVTNTGDAAVSIDSFLDRMSGHLELLPDTFTSDEFALTYYEPDASNDSYLLEFKQVDPKPSSRALELIPATFLSKGESLTLTYQAKVAACDGETADNEVRVIAGKVPDAFSYQGNAGGVLMSLGSVEERPVWGDTFAWDTESQLGASSKVSFLVDDSGIEAEYIPSESAKAAGVKGQKGLFKDIWPLGVTNSGSTVKLLADTVNASGTADVYTGNGFVDGLAVVPAGANVTLDLNGKTLQLAEGTSGSVITVRGTLTLTDVAANTGKITGGTGHSTTDAEMPVHKGNSYYGGGILVIAGGSVTMNGGQITGNRAGFGGGVAVGDNSSFKMIGGKICGNTAGDYPKVGAGVYTNGTFEMSGGEITGNTAEWDAGGVYVDSTFTMSGGEISSNTCGGDGGGVWISIGTFEMSGGKIYDNHAKNTNGSFGGGVGISDSKCTFTMSGGEITGNTTTGKGGGVSSGGGVKTDGTFSPEAGGTFTMTGGKVYNNTADVAGDDVYSDGVPQSSEKDTKLTLPDQATVKGWNVNLANSSKQITGWYLDGTYTESGYVDRWGTARQSVSFNISEHRERIALKAAYDFTNSSVEYQPAPEGDEDTTGKKTEEVLLAGKTVTLDPNSGSWTNEQKEAAKTEWTESGDKLTRTAPSTDEHVTITVADSLNPSKNKAVFVGWTMTKDADGNITLTAQYKDDKNEDKIPDEYQATVVYTLNTETGSWADAMQSKLADDKYTVTVTLYEKQTTGEGEKAVTKWVKLENPDRQIPQPPTTGTTATAGDMVNGTGYKETGAWTLTAATDGNGKDVKDTLTDAKPDKVELEGKYTYTFQWAFDKVTSYTITYHANNGKTGDQEEKATATAEAEKPYTVATPEGFTLTPPTVPTDAPQGAEVAFVGWSKTQSSTIYAHGDTLPDLVTQFTPTADTDLYAVWGLDKNGDDIPDVLQAVVTYEVENGKFGTGAVDASVEKHYTAVEDGTENQLLYTITEADITGLNAASKDASGYPTSKWQTKQADGTYTDITGTSTTPAGTTIEANKSYTFKLVYEPKTVSYTVTYNLVPLTGESTSLKPGTAVTDANPEEKTLTLDFGANDKKFGDKVTLNPPEKMKVDGKVYVREETSETGSFEKTLALENNYSFTYNIDNWGGTGEGSSDGVADCLQALVTFSAGDYGTLPGTLNGTASKAYTISEDTSITVPKVSVMYPEKYTFADNKWAYSSNWTGTDLPTTANQLNAKETYTFTAQYKLTEAEVKTLLEAAVKVQAKCATENSNHNPQSPAVALKANTYTVTEIGPITGSTCTVKFKVTTASYAAGYTPGNLTHTAQKPETDEITVTLTLTNNTWSAAATTVEVGTTCTLPDKPDPEEKNDDKKKLPEAVLNAKVTVNCETKPALHTALVTTVKGVYEELDLKLDLKEAITVSDVTYNANGVPTCKVTVNAGPYIAKLKPEGKHTASESSEQKAEVTLVWNGTVWVVAGTEQTVADITFTAKCDLSGAKQITEFTLPGQVGDTVYADKEHGEGWTDDKTGTITVTVPNGTVLKNLTPTELEWSDKASVAPGKDEAKDFSDPINKVKYIVTAEDGSTREYTVTVMVELPGPGPGPGPGPDPIELGDKVIVNLNGGSWDADWAATHNWTKTGDNFEQTVKSGTKVELTDPTKTDCRFDMWEVTKEIGADGKETGNIIYTAQYVQQYTITVNVTDGTAKVDNETVTSVKVDTGKDVTIAFVPTEGYALYTALVDDGTKKDNVYTPVKAGSYEFKGVDKDQTITVVYTEDKWNADDNTTDKKGDGIADEYQAVVQYVADANGSVKTDCTDNVKIYTIKTAEEIAALSADQLASFRENVRKVCNIKAEAAANSGYAFDNWTAVGFAPTGKWNSKLDEDRTLIGGDTYTVTAHFDKDGNDDGIADKYQQEVKFEVAKVNDQPSGCFTLNGKKVTELTVFAILTSKDADGKVVYDEHGTATLEKDATNSKRPTLTIPCIERDEDGNLVDKSVTFTYGDDPVKGYSKHANRDDGWQPNKTCPTTVQKADGAVTFTYTYEPSKETKYTIEYHFTKQDGTPADVNVTDPVLPQSGTGKTGDTVDLAFGRRVKAGSDNYVLTGIQITGKAGTPAPVSVTKENDKWSYKHTITAEEKVVLHVYYALDNWGEDDKPDDTPDDRQVRVQYVPTDDVKGKVDVKPVDAVVITLETVENGKYTGTITLEGAAAANDDSGLAFDYWTSTKNGTAVDGQIQTADLSKLADAAKTLNVTGGDSYIYTAHFDKDEKGDTDDETGEEIGDGIPDKYQAFVWYKAEPVDGNAVGTVTSLDPSEASLYRKYDLRQDGTEELLTEITTAGAKAEANETSGYAFDQWTFSATDGDGKAMTVTALAAQTAQNAEMTSTKLAVAGGCTYIFTATFAKDEKGSTDDTGKEIGDGIPDKYEAFVTFQADENGTLTSDGLEKQSSIVRTYDLRQMSEDGSYVTNEDGTLNLKTSIMTGDYVGKIARADGSVTAVANGNYVFSAWKLGEKVIQAASALKEDGTVDASKATLTTVEVEPDTSYIFTATFDTDQKGGIDPDTGEETGDGIPDKYQKKVTFAVTNGIWSDGKTEKVVYVELKTDGKWSETGSGSLTAPTDMTANTGYGSGSWDPAVPPHVSKTDADRYTYAFTANQYNVTFDTNGGTIVGGSEITVTYDGTYGDLPTATRPGYSFDGWYTDPTGGTQVTAGTDVTITADQTLYAHWSTVQYSITYILDNGTMAGNPEYYTIETPTFTLNNPTRSGYTFAGWTGTGLSEAARTVTIPSGSIGDREYTAHWTANGIIFPPTPTPTPTPTPVNPTPAPGGTTIDDQDVPLAGAVGLNDTDHFAYIAGYENNTVRPTANITRAEVAAIFFRLMTEEFRIANWSTENTFSDVKVGDWFNNAVSTCVKAGIIKGYEDGTFRPSQSITRAEFAAIAARFLGPDADDEGVGDFADTADKWYSADVRKAAKAGWISGMGGSRFEPNANITRAQVMSIVNRMLDRTPDADHMLPTMKTWIDNPEGTWYYVDVQEATNGHDYTRDETNIETWTAIQAEKNWAEIEAEWGANNGASASKDDAQPVEADGEAK